MMCMLALTYYSAKKKCKLKELFNILGNTIYMHSCRQLDEKNDNTLVALEMLVCGLCYLWTEQG